MRLRRHVAALCLAALLGACGGSSNDLLGDTASKLADIHSGILGMRFDILSSGALAGNVGFALRGPFALPQSGRLPVARLTFTRTTGTSKTSALLVSTGRQAFVGVGGSMYRLPAAQTEQLRSQTGSQGANPLVDLRIDDWMRTPAVSNGGTVGGAETRRIHGNMDVVSALNDLLDMAGGLGATQLAAVPRLEGAAADSVRRAVRSATMDVYTGTRDHLLRKLLIDVRFGVNPPPQLQALGGRLGGARLVLEFDVTDPNQPVHVAAPQHALPSSALPGAA